MHVRELCRAASAAALIAVSVGIAAPAHAAGVAVRIDTVNADNDFIALCGGSDNFGCEYSVAQGVAGNRRSNGNTEITVFDRLTNTAIGRQTSAPTVADFVNPSTFTLSFDADGGVGGLGRMTFDAIGIASSIVDDYDFGTPVGGDNPEGPAQSLVIRVARAAVSDLVVNGVSVPGVDVLSPADVGYIYIGGFDVTADWLVTGTINLSPAFQNSGTGFQIKVTDLAVPLGPSMTFLGAALGMLWMRRRRTKR